MALESTGKYLCTLNPQIDSPVLDCRDGGLRNAREFGQLLACMQVIKRALHHNAVAVIHAHNHPSGVAEPS